MTRHNIIMSIDGTVELNISVNEKTYNAIKKGFKKGTK